MVAFACAASAQITISKSSTGTPKQEAVLQMAWAWLYSHDGEYLMVLKSNNQFDDGFWLLLGKTKDECITSLNAIQELIDNIGETDRFEISNGRGAIFQVSQYKALGIKGLYLDDNSHAGSGYILPSYITKARRWIEQNLR